MLPKLSIAWLILLAFDMFMLAPAAPTPRPALVPFIDTNGFQLKPLHFAYSLSIRSPDGSLRKETVREIEPGQLQVSGVFDQQFDENQKNLKINYEAGANGYVAKYSYGNSTPSKYTTPPPTFIPPPQFLPPTSKPVSLNGCTLKTCTG